MKKKNACARNLESKESPRRGPPSAGIAAPIAAIGLLRCLLSP